MHQHGFRHWGSLQRSSNPQTAFRAFTSKERKKRQKGRKGIKVNCKKGEKQW